MSEDRESLFELGERYFSGDGRTQDLSSALDCFTRSAELGYAPAQFKLGLAYDRTGMARRYGISGNDAVAFQWYLKAAEQGYPNAMSLVAIAYHAGIKGAPQDQDKAAEWYARLLPSNDTYAMLQLGLMAVEDREIET